MRTSRSRSRSSSSISPKSSSGSPPRKTRDKGDIPIYPADASSIAPYHAHVYFTAGTQPAARALQQQLRARLTSDREAGLLVVEELDEIAVGPHPLPQFEIHCYERYLATLLPLLKASPLISVVHPVTDDDLADHTVLAQWIHGTVELDLTVLDPPGQNKALARFGKSAS